MIRAKNKMVIGLTYDLRQTYLEMGYSETETAEFDSVETIDALEQALGVLGHDTVRIGNGKELVQRLADGERWDIVFNIAEGLKGIGREAQVPAILDMYDIPYTFSDPMVMSLTLHKAMTKRVIRDAGLATAEFIVVEDLEDIERVQDIPFAPPFFVKPLSEGTGKGITAGSVIGMDYS
ncbi:MAG: D-alanine--D-alanine ligase, partial [Desulfamplus sp.]|nr:D-alanine--D-alanine ligase [Desulfamplus sp.]